MMHLDPERLAALQAGALPPDEECALLAHLEAGCKRCERSLAQLNVNALDGIADAAIARALPANSGAGNDLEFARILRAVGARPSRPRRQLLAGALAASLVIAGVAGLVAGRLRPTNEPPAWDGAKGAATRPVPVRLRFLEVDADGRMAKGISGERVRFTSSLLFEVEAVRPAMAGIARVSPAGNVEVIWRRRVAAGRTQVTLDGRPAAYPLAALSGPHRFVLVASEAGLDDARLEGAAATLAPPRPPSGDSPALDGLSLDLIDVFVR
jgi:hypothetical protein